MNTFGFFKDNLYLIGLAPARFFSCSTTSGNFYDQRMDEDDDDGGGDIGAV